LQAVRQEIKQLEAAYEHIMKQAKQKSSEVQVQQNQKNTGGVLV
jgi:hypothetical protein